MSAENFDNFLKSVFHAANVTEAEKVQIKTFFPEGCYFEYNGEGEPPTGSISVFRGSPTIEAACAKCRVSDCKVRKAPFKG